MAMAITLTSSTMMPSAMLMGPHVMMKGTSPIELGSLQRDKGRYNLGLPALHRFAEQPQCRELL